MAYGDGFYRWCKSLIYKEIKSFPHSCLVLYFSIYLYMEKSHTKVQKMSTQIVIDKLDMIRVMYDVCTITELSTVLGRDKSVVSRWAKLYTVPQKGRERTIFDIVTSHKKQKTKKVVTEEQIKEAAKKSVTMQNLARNLKMEYQSLIRIIRPMRCSKTHQPMGDVIKEILTFNRSVRYKSTYRGFAARCGKPQGV